MGYKLPFKLLLLYVETKKNATLSEKNIGFSSKENTENPEIPAKNMWKRPKNP